MSYYFMNLGGTFIGLYYLIMTIYLFQKYIKFSMYKDLNDFIDTDFILNITALFIKLYLITKVWQLSLDYNN